MLFQLALGSRVGLPVLERVAQLLQVLAQDKELIHFCHSGIMDLHHPAFEGFALPGIGIIVLACCQQEKTEVDKKPVFHYLSDQVADPAIRASLGYFPEEVR